ncbi:ABC transporter ATP-binding protein (plasmid) [Nitratireductor aquimarinus]|uniref:ABC transporter ATP-binding protein n=1 Tax=Nitratireductor aquimarinus TaxID=889300 RepID=UPI00398F5455
MMEKLLQVDNLKIEFKTENGVVSPVDNVSLGLHRGEKLAIVGESGCGKSVTSLAIMGLLGKTATVANGRMLFEGRELPKGGSREWEDIRGRDIAMIFQEPLTSLNPVFTVGEQISEPIRTHQRVGRAEARKRSIDLLKRVGINRAERVYDEYPHALSGGMRQRVMIAIALSCNPKLLIADEPTTALDVSIQAQILELMRGISSDYDTAIIIITHDLGVVAEMADRVVVMYAGQVVEVGDVFAIFENPRHPYTRGLLNCTPRIHELRDELEVIEGSVPSPLKMPKGCRFHPRCAFADERCISQQPELIEDAGQHAVRCWLFDEHEKESQ